MDSIRYSKDASICMAEVDGELVVASQEQMDTLPLGPDLTDDEIATLDE